MSTRVGKFIRFTSSHNQRPVYVDERQIINLEEFEYDGRKIMKVRMPQGYCNVEFDDYMSDFMMEDPCE